jgi:hypothetical protein
MLFRAFLLLTGFGLAVIGGISAVAYLNLLTTGYEMVDYLRFILKRFECYLLPIGIIVIWGSIYLPLIKSNSRRKNT